MHRSYVLPADNETVAYGTVAPVAGTPYDFTTPTAIGSQINDVRTDYAYGGYDIHYVLWGQDGPQSLAATRDCRVYDE